MTISELAAATGLTTHTLRYYDAEGLIPQVARTAAGHRRFRADHVKWVGLLERLRASGMSVARMREYARLATRGDATIGARRELLEEHEVEIQARVRELESCLTIVRAKIELYEGRRSPESVWALVEEARRGRATAPRIAPPARGTGRPTSGRPARGQRSASRSPTG